MADNIQLPGTGLIVATKDSNGVEYQVMLMADGSYSIISPATSVKQDLLLAELQLKAKLTDKQPVYDEGSDNSLRRILEQVSIPVWYDPVTNSLKAVVTGAVTASVASTTITSEGGIPSDPQIPSLLNTVWATGLRNLLT